MQWNVCSQLKKSVSFKYYSCYWKSVVYAAGCTLAVTCSILKLKCLAACIGYTGHKLIYPKAYSRRQHRRPRSVTQHAKPLTGIATEAVARKTNSKHKVSTVITKWQIMLFIFKIHISTSSMCWEFASYSDKEDQMQHFQYTVTFCISKLRIQIIFFLRLFSNENIH